MAVLAQMAERYGLDGDYETIEDLEAALDEHEGTKREEQIESTGREYYAQLARDLAQTLSAEEIAGHDEMGNPTNFKLSPAQVQKIFPLLNDFRVKVRDIEQQSNFDELADVALDVIPEDRVDDFRKAVEGKGLPLRQWFQESLEHAAPATKAWARREREFALDLAKAKAEAWSEGNQAPAGQPSQRGGGETTDAGPKDLTEARLMHAGMHPSGRTITSAEMRAFLARAGRRT